MSRRRRILLLTISGLLLIGGITLAIILNQPGKKQGIPSSNLPNATMKINPDTGEQIVTDPSLAQNESTDAGGVIILGLADLIDSANLMSQQSDYVKSSLTTYATQNLKDKYTTLTIQPENTKINNNTITTTVRLGDSTATVNMTFADGLYSGTMTLSVTDPNNTGGGSYTAPATALDAQ